MDWDEKELHFNRKKNRHNNTNLDIKFAIFIFGLFVMSIAPALVFSEDEVNSFSHISLHKLNPLYKEVGRGIASFVPDDEVEFYPFEQTIMVNRVIIEDSAGVLRSMKGKIQSWDKVESYVENWGLESTGLYIFPKYEDKRKYVESHALKYLDRRLSGEIKRAEKGSTLEKVGKVERALKPTTKVTITQNFKIRVKARLLEGKAYINFENPYFKCNSEIDFGGYVDLKMSKSLKNIGMTGQVVYKISGGYWVVSISQKIIKGVSAQVSSTQNDDKMMLSNDATKVAGLYYSYSF